MILFNSTIKKNWQELCQNKESIPFSALITKKNFHFCMNVFRSYAEFISNCVRWQSSWHWSRWPMCIATVKSKRSHSISIHTIRMRNGTWSRRKISTVGCFFRRQSRVTSKYFLILHTNCHWWYPNRRLWTKI